MGGDSLKQDEESSRSSSSSSSPCSYCFSDDFGFSYGVSDMARREKSYQQILQSFYSSHNNSKRRLRLARNQILSYKPGSWSDVDLRDYDIPETTSILIVGPKSAGKSSLVNKITRVIEADEFAPPRAQQSYGTSSTGGTFFVHEYMIPRGSSSSFSLFDTRGSTQISSSDYTSKIEQWMTRGVHHGEPVIWSTDSSELRERLIGEGGSGCCEMMRKVNSVIFVVNAVEILKSMSSEERSYAHMVSTAFNCPSLSFKDDKPAVVMTHGDVLSLEERARVQVFLGELLGISPNKQIFDIPESVDTATGLTVCKLLRHSLEQADKNLHFLPKRKFAALKIGRGVFTTRMKLFCWLTLLYILPLLMNTAVIYFGRKNVAPANQNKEVIDRSPPLLNDFTRPRRLRRRSDDRLVKGRGPYCHMISKDEVHRFPNCAPVRNRDPVPDGDPSMGSDEQKVAEPDVDWRNLRGLWYAE